MHGCGRGISQMPACQTVCVCKGCKKHSHELEDDDNGVLKAVRNAVVGGRRMHAYVKVVVDRDEDVPGQKGRHPQQAEDAPNHVAPALTPGQMGERQQFWPSASSRLGHWLPREKSHWHHTARTDCAGFHHLWCSPRVRRARTIQDCNAEVRRCNESVSVKLCTCLWEALACWPGGPSSPDHPPWLVACVQVFCPGRWPPSHAVVTFHIHPAIPGAS